MKLSEIFKGVRLPKPPPYAQPKELAPPETCYLPLRQHRGQICETAVEVGDEVRLGQLIGKSDAFEAAEVHATVCGKVEAIREMPDPAGQMVPTVVITRQGEETWVEGEVEAISDAAKVAETRPSRLLKRLRAAGLVRASSQGLPLHVDLSPPMAPRSYMYMTGIPVVRAIDTLIIRAVDPDPPVSPNGACLGGDPELLLLGISTLARISGAKRSILAVPSGVDLGEAAELLAGAEVEIATLCPTRYPYADHTLIVRELTGREVPTPMAEPRDVGVVVEPLLSALDVGRVLTTGRPVIDRVFAVAGDVANPGVFKVRLGTPISEVLQAAGGISGEPGKIVVGGPMMGLAVYDLDSPVTKETDGIFVQSKANLASFADHACIHCGRCVAACPVNLIPSELGKLCEYGMFDDAADKADLFHCIECGCCAYVCPAKRPLVHLFRHGKSEIMAERVEQ